MASCSEADWRQANRSFGNDFLPLPISDLDVRTVFARRAIQTSSHAHSSLFNGNSPQAFAFALQMPAYDECWEYMFSIEANHVKSA